MSSVPSPVLGYLDLIGTLECLGQKHGNSMFRRWGTILDTLQIVIRTNRQANESFTRIFSPQRQSKAQTNWLLCFALRTTITTKDIVIQVSYRHRSVAGYSTLLKGFSRFQLIKVPTRRDLRCTTSSPTQPTEFPPTYYRSAPASTGCNGPCTGGYVCAQCC